MASIDGESLELEVKHKENGSWHPCRVSLSSSDSKFDLIVDFENSNDEDIISNREDALERLRFRSTPLQDGECSHIKEGDTVLARYKDQFKSFFFDAVIEKLHRVRHSTRVFCRCTFEIKWLNAGLEEETVTIPSKSIMRLSTKDIGSNSIFSSFLSALTTQDRVEAPLSFSFLEEANSEADLLQGILERQIEEISKLADGQMESSADLLEVKRYTPGGCKQSKAAINNQNGFRRTTRRQSKEHNEVEIKKKPEDDKPFLTPLAARAAFASLIHEHELPPKRELPFSHAVKEGQYSLVGEDIKMHSLNVRHEQIKYDVSSDDSIPYPSSPSGEESEDETWSTIVNKSSDSRKVGKMTARSMATRITRSSANKEVLSNEVMEVSSYRVSTRKTRSSVHKETEASSDEAKQVSSADNLASPAKTSRLTRSRKQKENGNPGTNQEPRKIDLTQDSDGISEESEDVYTKTVVNQSGRSSTNRVTRSSLHKEHEASPDGVELESSSKRIISPNARLTRSRPQKEESDAGVATPVHDEKKKMKASHGDSGPADANWEDGESASGERKKTVRKKAASAQKPQLRFSPRLRKA